MGSSSTQTVVVGAHGRPVAVRQVAFEVRVLGGPDRGLRTRCEGARMVVGRGEHAELQLTDETVSFSHCALELDASGIRVVDLDSKNGVFIGKRRVREAWLAHRDTFRAGAVELRLEVSSDVVDRPLWSESGFGQLLGASVAMRHLYGQLARAARSDAAVLLLGETGTGKELAAEALVSEGLRAQLPYVVVDCGALSHELADSDLFGHEGGAFTGAKGPRAGALERAADGTVFFDEVGELSLAVQAKLLGVLGRGRFTRVGGAAELPFRARVVSATHRDLDREVNRGAFRADLYHRLAALTVRLPALRERAEDVPALVGHFLERAGRPVELSPAALARLYSADYPGNVRELRNEVERAVAGVAKASAPSSPGRELPIDLQRSFREQKDEHVAGFERAYLTRLLAECGANLSEAARRSGIDRTHLYRMLKRHGLDVT
ncbi:MAG: sigma 54-dependent Fis family transcriptional regulator [Archangiaceae bacterium]|nr:sigma 54-dependent Fis family transcriptional regulator [Archangiaceae bacterium]